MSPIVGHPVQFMEGVVMLAMTHHPQLGSIYLKLTPNLSYSAGIPLLETALEPVTALPGSDLVTLLMY